jgi:dihydrofolate reductase
MQTRPRIHLIAACDMQAGIGKGGEIPWDYPEDRRFFRAVTMGKPVLMGRVTYESIGKPLVGRRVLVLSRSLLFRPRPGDEAATRNSWSREASRSTARLCRMPTRSR